MLPMRFFREGAFAAANAASLLANFGMFGSIFLLTQFFQTVQGLSPVDAGLRVLPWTLMPMVVAPITGALADRIGGRQLMAAGLALQAGGLAWSAAVDRARCGVWKHHRAVRGDRHRNGNVLRPAVRPQEEGIASGANSAVREVGGVLGVAVLASIFSRAGGYATPDAFVDGLVRVTWVGAGVVAAAALVALALPRRRTGSARDRGAGPVLRERVHELGA